MSHAHHPPLFCGAVAAGQRVLVEDPRHLSHIRGPGIVHLIEIVAGRPWRIHVDMGPTRIASVPPEWVTDDPAAAANIIAFRRPIAPDEWPPALFRDAPPRNP